MIVVSVEVIMNDAIFHQIEQVLLCNLDQCWVVI
jgi:hypothetical protein